MELQPAAMATYALEPNGQNAVLRGSKTIRSNLDRDVRAILEALKETLRATQQLNGQDFLERKVSTLELDKRRLQARINKVESEKAALQLPCVRRKWSSELLKGHMHHQNDLGSKWA